MGDKDKNISIREWQKNYAAGYYVAPDVKTMIAAGWYDWFCDDGDLPRRLRPLAELVAKITDGGKVNLDENYVFFKNNCPGKGTLYDSLSICSLKNGQVLLHISKDDKRDAFRWVVSGITENDKDDFRELYGCNDRKSLLAWLNSGQKKEDSRNRRAFTLSASRLTSIRKIEEAVRFLSGRLEYVRKEYSGVDRLELTRDYFMLAATYASGEYGDASIDEAQGLYVKKYLS